MSKYPCIMVKFIINDFDSGSCTLQAMLEKKVSRDWPQARVTIEEYIDYWKIPDSKVLICGIIYEKSLNVKDFIQDFAITWHYTITPVRNVTIEKEYNEESAVWSKLNNPSEEFLHSDVRWVHVYTWPEV